MAEIVNLRMARKRMARAEEEQKADRNRVLHGRTKAAKDLDRLSREREIAYLDGHKRGESGGSDT